MAYVKANYVPLVRAEPNAVIFPTSDSTYKRHFPAEVEIIASKEVQEGSLQNTSKYWEVKIKDRILKETISVEKLVEEYFTQWKVESVESRHTTELEFEKRLQYILSKEIKFDYDRTHAIEKRRDDGIGTAYSDKNPPPYRPKQRWRLYITLQRI